MNSLLEYYRKNTFNPVPISVEDHEIWNDHVAKRRNLYERHLGIPLALLRDLAVIEFGCNSGENSLVLAMYGANLTLVEPNEQVLPRLSFLFDKFGLSSRIAELRQDDITAFQADKRYDLVIAEGFLHTLSNREQLINKIGELLVPGGIAVISFNDRYGSWLEYLKRLILCRACRLASEDGSGPGSLELAHTLFYDDFAKLKASRSFEAWWKDTLVNPFFAVEYLWSFQELIPLIEASGCMLLSSSPRWSLVDHYAWYKNALSLKSLHRKMLQDWERVFSYILTGLPPNHLDTDTLPDALLESVAGHMNRISAYTSGSQVGYDIRNVAYPSEIDYYLCGLGDPNLSALSKEIREIFDALHGTSLENLITSYNNSIIMRSLWGTAYYYMSFIKGE